MPLRWSDNEIEMLMLLWGEKDLTTKDIARKINDKHNTSRSKDGVYHKYRNLKKQEIYKDNISNNKDMDNTTIIQPDDKVKEPTTPSARILKGDIKSIPQLELNNVFSER